MGNSKFFESEKLFDNVTVIAGWRENSAIWWREAKRRCSLMGSAAWEA